MPPDVGPEEADQGRDPERQDDQHGDPDPELAGRRHDRASGCRDRGPDRPPTIVSARPGSDKPAEAAPGLAIWPRPDSRVKMPRRGWATVAGLGIEGRGPAGDGQFPDLHHEAGRPVRRAEDLRGAGQPGPGAGRSAPTWRSTSRRSETKIFSEGNVFVRVLENVRGRDVFVVQGTEQPGQRQLHGVAVLDRRLQARQRHPGHRGHPLLLLCQGGQEGRAPGLDPRPGLRRCPGSGGGRPGPDDGPAQRPDPGVLQGPRRPPDGHAGPGRLLPEEADPRPRRRLARRGQQQASVQVRPGDAGRVAGDRQQGPDRPRRAGPGPRHHRQLSRGRTS